LLVAIDGPAGAGKSTVARMLARELGFTYLDSGAMYRCVALLSLQQPAGAPAELARRAGIELVAGEGEGAGRVLLDGRDVSEEIRSAQVSDAASVIAADPGVREALVDRQRQLMSHGDWVAEGRDIGTVVAPDAELKIFLTADPGERARRRAGESGDAQESVLAEQEARDRRDTDRAHGPLLAAPGAVTVDSTGLAVEQVVARIAALARGA